LSSGVFICYRREDSAGFARLIYDRLTSKLGRDAVFFDVDNIPAGFDFVDILSERVGKCDTLIAVIGKDWVSSTDVHNRRRLDDRKDFVRIEIEAALERKIRVIPVLVNGAQMPEPDDLPTGIKALARRQGIEISHTRFDSDVDRLVRGLVTLEDEHLPTKAPDLAAGEEHEIRRPGADAVEKAEQARETTEAARRDGDARRERGGADAKRAASLERSGLSRRLGSRLILAVAVAVTVGAAALLLEYGSGRVSVAKDIEYNVDRPGSDYKGFDLAQSDPALCQESCEGEAQCRAWTFVKAGLQGPKARCWLKNLVPPATASACCASGFKATK
jgi:hypothetical protein